MMRMGTATTAPATTAWRMGLVGLALIGLVGCEAAPQTAAPSGPTLPEARVLMTVSGPLDRDQIRRKVLDRCILGKWNRDGIDRKTLATQCSCASSRYARDMSPADIDAYNQARRLPGSQDAVFLEAFNRCGG